MNPITLSEAKAKLGRLADRALKTGEPVIIARGRKYVQLLPWQPIEPIPAHPVGSLPTSETERELENLAGPDVGPEDL